MDSSFFSCARFKLDHKHKRNNYEKINTSCISVFAHFEAI